LKLVSFLLSCIDCFSLDLWRYHKRKAVLGLFLIAIAIALFIGFLILFVGLGFSWGLDMLLALLSVIGVILVFCLTAILTELIIRKISKKKLTIEEAKIMKTITDEEERLISKENPITPLSEAYTRDDLQQLTEEKEILKQATESEDVTQ